MLSGHTPSLSNIPRMQEIFFQRQQSFDVFMLLTGTVTGLIRAGVVSRPVMSMGEDEALVCYGLLWKQGLMGTILCVIMCHAVPSEISHRIETPKVDSTIELPACYWLNLSLSSSHSFTACVQFVSVWRCCCYCTVWGLLSPWKGKENWHIGFWKVHFFFHTQRERKAQRNHWHFSITVLSSQSVQLCPEYRQAVFLCVLFSYFFPAMS